MNNKLFNKSIFKCSRSTIISMVIWSAVISALVVLSMSMFPTVKRIFSTLPPDIKMYIGNMDNINTYFESICSIMWVLLVCIYGAALVFKLITREIKGKACVLVYTAPVSRAQIVRTKALRILLNITVVNMVVSAFALMSLYLWGSTFSVGNYFVYSAFVWVVSIIVTYTLFGLALCFGQKGGLWLYIAFVLGIYIMFVFIPNSHILTYFTPLSTLGGGILQNGIFGVPEYGIPLIIWFTFMVLISTLGCYKFKNSDLC